MNIKLIVMEWVGSHFSSIEETSCYLEGNVLYNEKQEQVATLPFIPEIVTTSSRSWGSWYSCPQLTEEENEDLEMSYTHYSGSTYREYVNQNSKYRWLLYFLNKYIKGE
jgi:hypothetical protein